MQWFIANLGSIVCGLLVLAIAAVALRSWILSKKKGGGCSGCSGCSGCGGACSMCGSKPAEGQTKNTYQKKQ